jgi:hypothetical protein
MAQDDLNRRLEAGRNAAYFASLSDRALCRVS